MDGITQERQSEKITALNTIYEELIRDSSTLA